MPLHETAAWSAIHVAALTLWMAFMTAALMRLSAAKGTHRRYVWATLQWAVAFPALGLPVRHVAHFFLTGDPVALGIGAILFFIWALDMAILRRDNDDNWFKRTGKRLRRWARARIAALTPMPAPVNA